MKRYERKWMIFSVVHKMNLLLSHSNFLQTIIFSFVTFGYLVPTWAADSRDWPVYLGDKANSHFSDLTQVNTGNVQRLEMAWNYHSAGARGGSSQIQCNPLIVGNVLYGTSPNLDLFALDAATGRELWRFNPFQGGGGGVNRGLVYWSDKTDRRLLFTASSFLYAVDATSGKSLVSFGTNGCVDLRNGLGRDASKLYIIATTPGIVHQDLLILGTRERLIHLVLGMGWRSLRIGGLD
jgi:quinoprotein glucose dehydrogenase